ncbi:MAG: TonB-dependent receptor, partial [Sedimentisphaerales bacterium]|nr:TonB-dependent receptor [Sedimentisphaerales bacterium]
AFGYKRDNYRFSTTWRHDNFSLNWFVYSLAPQKNNSNQETGFFMNQTMGLRPKYIMNFTDTESLELNGSFLWGDFGDIGCNGYIAGMQGGSERHWEFKPIFKTTRFENHQLALGGSYGYKQFRNAEYYFTHDPDQGTESIDTHWNERSLFAEDIISIADKLTLSLGIRYDEYKTGTFIPSLGTNPTGFKPDQMGGHVSPRIALAYEIDKQTNVKASYQQGFRMPDAAYYNWNSYNNNAAKALGFSQSPALTPETMDSWELDFQKKWTEKLEAGLNLYYNTFTDQLSWGPLENCWTPTQVYNPGGAVDSINEWTGVTWGGGMFQNISGSYHIWGFETPIKYALTDNTDVDVSYGFSKIIDNVDHGVKQKYPLHQVKVNLMSRFLEDRLSVGINYVYNSPYTETMYYPTAGDSLNDHYKNPRDLVDLSVVYKVNKNLKIKGVVKNLLGDRTPPSNNRMNVPNWGNTGYDEIRVYLSAEMTF